MNGTRDVLVIRCYVCDRYWEIPLTETTLDGVTEYGPDVMSEIPLFREATAHTRGHDRGPGN